MFRFPLDLHAAKLKQSETLRVRSHWQLKAANKSLLNGGEDTSGLSPERQMHDSTSVLRGCDRVERTRFGNHPSSGTGKHILREQAVW